MILINIVTILFGTITIGWLTGNLQEVMIGLFAFALLRSITGGYHFESSSLCILFSIVAFCLLPYVPVTPTWNIILIAISALLTAIFAPTGLGDQSNIPPKYYPYLKILSVALILGSSFLFFQVGALAKAYFIQSLTLLLVKRR